MVQARVLTHFGRIVFWTIPCFLLALIITGCGGSGTHLSVSAAPTLTFSASPTSIAAGATSTLTAAATNATSVTITGSDGSSYNLTATGGTQAVTPAATTTYTATAVGNGGKTTATATVTVAASAPPAPTVTISASPASIAAGASSTLTVAATNATQVTIAGSDGSSYSLAATGGTQSVTPGSTTTYTATATGAGGTVTATATVTVTTSGPAPTITLNANPTSVTPGTSSLLTVTAANATAVTITGTDGSSYTLTATGGTQSVTPKTTTTYTATATGPGGKTSATATVTVSANPVPTVNIAAVPPSITAGASSQLTVAAQYATTVTLVGSDGSNYSSAMTPTGGIQDVSPAATTTYTATASGPGGTVTATAIVTVTPNPAPTVTISASPATITSGGTSTLTVTATNATTITITGTDTSSYSLTPPGGTQAVTPTATTTYTATATGPGGTVTAGTTVTVNPAGSVQQINHVIFELQENHSFDNYFGMLNPYRAANKMNVGDDGVTYTVDGIDDKLTKFPNPEDTNSSVAGADGYNIYPFRFASTCVDDMSSDWLSSYGDVDRYDFTLAGSSARKMSMNGFVHTASGYAANCASRAGTSNACPDGNFTDTAGERAMGYYDENTLNYYYYMASQFAVSDRWFSPVSDKSIDNRIATFTGGTTQGLVLDPGGQDHLPQLAIKTIFQELDNAKVTWKIYYTVTEGFCTSDDECPTGAYSRFPATDFGTLSYSYNYLYIPKNGAACAGTTQPSSVVGDSSNSFCIDPTRIAPISQYYTDLQSGQLPSFAFIEAGYANNDEHPGSGQSILAGQAQVAQLVNALMNSSSWSDSVFFFSYDEGGGPFDHVPPVPGHTNDYTDAASQANYPDDISTIAVNADSYKPCIPPAVVGTDGTTTYPATTHCDLPSGWPGASPTDAPAVNGFAAQLGFRLPNIVISPFTRKHYVSHIPMDHTAIIKFVEDRFIQGSPSLTPRDQAQPNLLDFFDFNNIPWSTPPTNIPAPFTTGSASYNQCNAASFGQKY